MPRDPAIGSRAAGNHATKPDRIAHLTKDAWRGFVRALQARLAAHGVSFGHWTFLRILWEHDGLTQRELSDEAGVMEPTTGAAIRAMEKLGYVTRTRNARNRKNVYVHLTPKGRALKSKLVPLAVEVNEIGLAGVSAQDRAATQRTLLAILENLSRSSRPKP
ncbi:MAG: MarR family transcriptional regulator [Betaproteobacteria bacterium]|nr:MAG: MarR family transcriptional regulator [Betaproteobacteria bacterium]TMH45681.1 MAG: MarR family transcriptional regulator [Betaproteobacteria bacterium]